LIILLFGLVSTIILSVLGKIVFWNSILKNSRSAIKFVAGLVGVVMLFVPSIRLLFFAQKNSEVSRGDAIFAEASQTVQDGS
jgi:hypothetical protein